MMDKQLAERDLLWMADDDWTGLWEAWWSLQSAWPELQGEPAVQAAHALLKDLVARGLVYLCFFEAESNSETPMSSEVAYETMEDRKSWEPPDGDKQTIRFATTPGGKKEMYKLEAALKATGRI